MITESRTDQVTDEYVVSTPGAAVRAPRVPVGYVPTPTLEYRQLRKLRRATIQSSAPPKPTSVPIPPLVLPGARVLMWKQDPTVAEIGVRKAFLPAHVFAGPRDPRITIQGVGMVSPNVFGDMIETPGTDAFDAVHTFAVVRQTLTMYQRVLASALPWQWNNTTNSAPIQVFPHAGVTMNAYYSRTERALKFFYFNKSGDPPGPPWHVFTCQSLDIVAHETGHAILDGLQPGWIGSSGNPPQTGGLHESFGDLTAIFLALSQFDQIEAIIAQTQANLHAKTFLADLAENFGLALGRTNGLRNADNDLKLSEAGTEVHAISQVFTGAIYDILADIFAFERKPAERDDAQVLYEAATYLRGLVLRSLIASPPTSATYADVANHMLSFCAADNKPVQYRNSIRNQFTVREVFAPTPLSEDVADGVQLAAALPVEAGVIQDRHSCCGTMQLGEFNGEDALLQQEMQWMAESFRNGPIATLRQNGRGAALQRTMSS